MTMSTAAVEPHENKERIKMKSEPTVADSNDLYGEDEDRLLRIKEAAAILSISVRALYRLVADKQLPAPVKIGRATRIPRSDIDHYIASLKNSRNLKV